MLYIRGIDSDGSVMSNGCRREGYTLMKLKEQLKENEDITAQESVRRRNRRKRILIILAAFILCVILAAALLHAFFVKPPELYAAPETNEPAATAASDPETVNDVSASASPAADDRGEGVVVEAGGERKSDYYTFLLCGTDAGEYLTDTIMVASYDVKNQKLNIVSVPRDSMLNVTWTVKRVNTAYAIGGIDRLMEELTRILGFHVDFYASVNLAAFVEIIDEIGGVEYDVPQDMKYSDPGQGLYIDLKAGMQRLNGEKAMELIRFRSYAQGDIQRISVQQSFLKATANQVLKVGNITKINEIAEILSKYMDTDLSVGNIIWLGEKMLSLKMADIGTSTLPGSGAMYNEQSYWLLDAAGVVDIVNENINPYKSPISLSDLDIVTLGKGSIVSVTGKPVLTAPVTPSENQTQDDAAPEAADNSDPENTSEPTEREDSGVPAGEADEGGSDGG